MLEVSIFRRGLFVLAVVLGLAGWQGLAIADEHEGAPPVALEGEILVVHIDYFDRGKSETVYHLRDRNSGTVYELRFERRAPQSLRSGDNVTVTGRGLGSKIWVQDIAPGLQQDWAEESQVEEPAEAESPAAFERRAILMIINMATAPDYYTEATALTGAAEMFTGSFSVNTLYQEASFGQMAFPGDRANDVIILDNIPYNANCPYNTIASDADQAATDAGVDLSQYHHKVYLVPPSSISDCGWLAIGQVGSYGSTATRLSWSTRNDVVAYSHEIGHNHGWHHAATDPENDLTMNSEYGDTSDIMGYCCSERKFNSAHVDQIGWFDSFSGTVLTVVAGGIYDIAPLGSDPAATAYPQVLKIDRPNTTQDYYLSYRQRNELDASLNST
ncbi:MAG: reprolysin-like metallopeptidase, partial [Alphaproteobacteria bacterium]